MELFFTFITYQRPFLTPLVTNHGTWKVRDGLIIYLVDQEGRIGKGEIAPLPWFGSEFIAEAIAFCQKLKKEKLTENIFNYIPTRLTACQFGLATAWEDLQSPSTISEDSLSYSYLLPTGEKAISICAEERKKGRKTFKWKIATQPLETELQIFSQLVSVLKGAKLRLDANGGLNHSEAIAWLKVADQTNVVEFLEQPLPPQEFASMLKLSQKYHTAIALDESVATLTELETCYHQGWRGIYVVKPAIAGSPHKLRQLYQQYPLDIVFSSVFETEVGRQAIFKLAKEFNLTRPLGFSVNQWFKEN